jgi:rubrerythrin
MSDLPEHLKPAKEEDAPEGYTLCSTCKGQKLVGPDGEACVCAIYGQHAGYMKKIVTTIWSCIVCGDAIISKDHPHDVAPFEAGPPEPWAKREIIYHPGTEHEKKAWRGVCPDCKNLPKEEAYKKIVYTYWIFAEDENDPKNWICPSCFTKYEKGPYYLCSKCGYKNSKYYDYRYSESGKRNAVRI